MHNKGVLKIRCYRKKENCKRKDIVAGEYEDISDAEMKRPVWPSETLLPMHISKNTTAGAGGTVQE